MSDRVPRFEIHQGGADHVDAHEVHITEGGAGRIEAHEVHITMGGAGQVHADAVSVSLGGVGLARVRELKLHARSGAVAVAADRADIAEGARVFLLLARRAGGAGRPIVDWRVALAVGAGLGLVRLLDRRPRGR